MCVLNQIDRFHLVIDVIDRVTTFGPTGAYLREQMADDLIHHTAHIREFGEDLPEISSWAWEG
jgi:xylulose-5-phosphate/fructose-6-phosphate phosphoketolase